ncbi:hypothetical protein F0U60_52135 [Archangium minus]|uniref:Lipoprotein n=1 Tax=Archangium minus TaxID=83450 RepID=A0ABY9X8P5_9BACT|nr:hypothetical protein F0U60_52135 [Archangium minus]
MRVNWRKLGPVSLLLLVACSGLPLFGRSSAHKGNKNAVGADVQVPPRTVMEIQDIHYDGWTLSARLLVSPETGPLRLDRRLIPSIDVDVSRVSECEHGSVSSIHADVFAPLQRSENLLILNPGYWYGTTVHFGLFDEHFTGLGPECVEADISLRSFDRHVVAHQRIRAVRPSSMDGGTQADGGSPEEPAPSPDAGFSVPPN